MHGHRRLPSLWKNLRAQQLHKFNISIRRVWRHWGQHHYTTLNSQEDSNTHWSCKASGRCLPNTTNPLIMWEVKCANVVSLFKKKRESSQFYDVTRESFCPMVILEERRMCLRHTWRQRRQKECLKRLRENLCSALSEGNVRCRAILSNEINKTQMYECVHIQNGET